MNKIAFCVLGTNKYIDLAENCIASIKKYVQIPGYTVESILFTNQHRYVLKTHTVDHLIHIDHKPWPLITLLRYYYFSNVASFLSQYNYIYYIDADLEAVSLIGNEILGNRVATKHPGWWGQNPKLLPFDRTSGSEACIKSLHDKYYYGAFQGGSSKEFIAMCNILSDRICKDLKSNYIALWHDESHMNKYFMEHPPDIELSSDYAWPQEYGSNVNAKIIAKSKNHDEIRKE